MVREKWINGKRFRNYINGAIWISDDGISVKESKKLKSGIYVPGKELDIKTDSEGEKYVEVRGGYIYVKKAVYTCYCPPKHKDIEYAEIVYKDGNKSNVHYKNLDVQPITSKHTMTDTCTWLNGLEVTKTGEVYYKDKKQNVNDSIYDGDLDLEVYIDPHIFDPTGKSRGRIHIDDLMAESGYIDGDKYSLKNPVILHRDYNPVNYDSSNLEWVESTDPRYKDYMGKVKEYRHQRNVELNPGQRLPKGY